MRSSMLPSKARRCRIARIMMRRTAGCLRPDVRWRRNRREGSGVAPEKLPLERTRKRSHLNDLVAQKLGGPERSVISNPDLDFHRPEYERLGQGLQLAFERSRVAQKAGIP